MQRRINFIILAMVSSKCLYFQWFCNRIIYERTAEKEMEAKWEGNEWRWLIYFRVEHYEKTNCNKFIVEIFCSFKGPPNDNNHWRLGFALGVLRWYIFFKNGKAIGREGSGFHAPWKSIHFFRFLVHALKMNRFRIFLCPFR